MSLAAFLEDIYVQHNDSRLIPPDPLQFVHRYADPADQEIAGLLASALAFGRVEQISAAVCVALRGLERPAAFARDAALGEYEQRFRRFRYRFVTGRDLALLFTAVGGVVREWGSLRAWFAQCLRWDSPLEHFVAGLRSHIAGAKTYLLADPAGGSACKRLHLYLRWMVRRDRVDPGPWSGVPPACLMVPVDTHMHGVGIALGFTARSGADATAVEEITGGFRALRPDDPARYDFALARMSMKGREGLLASLEALRGGRGDAQALDSGL